MACVRRIERSAHDADGEIAGNAGQANVSVRTMLAHDAPARRYLGEAGEGV
jgi:hypothetical protein